MRRASRMEDNDTGLDVAWSAWSNVTTSPGQWPTRADPAVPVGVRDLAAAIALGLALYALSLTTVVGNAMVLHAIRTERTLQTVSNMFIMSLAVADLTVGLFVMPLSSAYAITGDWRLGPAMCQLWLSADYTASTASIFNLMVLSLDRYWSIRSPLKYLRKRTRKRALCMIAIAWLVSASWVLPIACWRRWQGDRAGPPQHPELCDTEFADDVLFKLMASAANFYLPMVVMIMLYAKIFTEIRKRSRLELGQCGASRRTGSNRSVNEATEAPGCQWPIPDSSTPSPRATLRVRVTRQRLASSLRQQKKAARQLGVIMGALVLCWLPYTVTFVVTAHCHSCVSARVQTLTIWLGYLNSAANPFLYALCNTNFKRAFKKMVCRDGQQHLATAKSDHLFA